MPNQVALTRQIKAILNLSQVNLRYRYFNVFLNSHDGVMNKTLTIKVSEMESSRCSHSSSTQNKVDLLNFTGNRNLFAIKIKF